MCIAGKKEEAPVPYFREGNGKDTLKQNSANGDVIDQLNALTKKKSAQADVKPDDPAFGCYELVKKGHTVFKKRSFVLLYTVWGFILLGLVLSPSWAFTVGCLIFCNLYVEFYGAVLHVVLDNPNFLNLPLLGEACLEFQWHHIIPHEITDRRYKDIAGDLNVLVFIELVLHLLAYHGLKDPAQRCVGAAVAFNAYLGQWAHRQAHMRPSAKHPLAAKMQKWGLLVTPELHRAHHRTYDTGFPILTGLSDPLINAMLRTCDNQWAWLALFITLTLGGITLCMHAYIPLHDALATAASGLLAKAA